MTSHSLPNAGSLIFAVSAALLSITVGLIFDIAKNATKPRRGKPITKIHYDVNVELLQSSRQHWTDVPESVHAATGQLAATFSSSVPDDSLRRFLEASANATSSRQGQMAAYAKQLLFNSLQRYLGWSRTDASGFVSKATLYVASEDQFRQLLAPGREEILINDNGNGAKKLPMLLDIGSGTGSETVKLTTALGIDAGQATCIETSTSMQKKLKSQGFQVADSFTEIASSKSDADDDSPPPLFSTVALLNVLDRCDDPGQILDAAINMLEPDGKLVLAIVLPFGGRVFEGKMWTTWGKAASRAPASPMRIVSTADTPKSFELGLATFMEAILRLQPQLELVKWTRLPYISSGDHIRTHYTIDMAVLTLRLSKEKQKVPSLGYHTHTAPNYIPDHSTSDSMASSGIDERRIPAQCQKRSADKIFSWLTTTLTSNGYGESSWGHVLDAGAGISSMCWLTNQNYDKVTGVTAKPKGTDSYGDVLESIATSDIEIVLGNWQDDEFMKDRYFDIVVSDYLLGSTELHWKYGAENLIERLLSAVKPSGFLLIVGLEPYETILDRANAQDRLVLDIEAIGDSAATLAGHSTYRELPEEWVRQQIERRPNFRIVATQQFAMRLTAKSLRKQIAYANKTASKIDDRGLREAHAKRIKDLEISLETFTVHRRARNYAIVVQRENDQF